MAARRSTIEWKLPRRMRRRVSVDKKFSTAFSHEPDVGVKWKVQRGCRTSKAPAAAGSLLLFELIDEIDEIKKASPDPGADDCAGDGDGEMGFAGAGAADEDGVALGIQKRAGGEFRNQSRIDGGVSEDEFIQVLEDRELGAAVDAKARQREAIADRAGLPVGAFGADQTGDEGRELTAPGQPLAGNLIEAGAHAEPRPAP